MFCQNIALRQYPKSQLAEFGVRLQFWQRSAAFRYLSNYPKLEIILIPRQALHEG
jgi:hypothetical protein